MPWLDPERIKVVEFTGPDGVDALRDDIELLIQQFDSYDPDFVDGMAQFYEYLTLVYVDDEPAAMIDIRDNRGEEVGKDTLTFGACILPEYRGTGLERIAVVAIRKAFKKTGKKKMLASIAEHNRPAQHGVLALGFRRIGKDANKDLLYRLDRNKALAQKTF